MNKLQQAYIDLGLQPGAPLEKISERWRTVVRMWHPDRASSEQERAAAELELKKVNGARDLLVRHFEDGLHRLVNCECTGAVNDRYAERDGTTGSATASSKSNDDGLRSAKGAAPRTGPAAGSSSKASPAQAKAETRWKKQKVGPVQQGMAAALTIAMIGIGMFIVKASVHLIPPPEVAPQYYGQTPDAASWVKRGRSGVSQGTLFALRPSAANAPVLPTDAAEQIGLEHAKTPAKPSIEEKPMTTAAVARQQPSQQNLSVIKFVSSHGRLVSLQDGTTWSLWSTEAPESFFHWERGDKIILKGINSSPCWIVNESRNFQAVQVSRVE